MNRYLVESPHTKEDCLKVLDMFVAYGHITHFEFGCDVGVHSGWVIIEAKNENEALLSVPPMIRNKAKVVRLVKYSPEQIQEFHKK